MLFRSANGATVSVTIPDGVRFVAGDGYAIVTADNLSVDVATLTLDTNIPVRYRPVLKKIGNSLVLSVAKPGLNIIVW